MTKVAFLESLKQFTLDATEDLLMPVAMQKGDSQQICRAPDVYLMSLPDFKSAEKKAPYVIHQLLPGTDVQAEGKPLRSTVEVRSIFTVCSPCKTGTDSVFPDKQEGWLMLLNFMERVRISLLKAVVIDNRYMLDLSVGIESLPYPESQETAITPYCVGEMRSTWVLPAVKREV